MDVPRKDIDAIVLDIEGTTTPIAFVYEVLFPFARRHLREFLKQARGSEVLADALLKLQLEWADDAARGEAPPPWAPADAWVPDAELRMVAAYLEWLMDRDRKSPALKSIQGLLWQRGYDAGELTSVVFPDVAPALDRWKADGLTLAIYSSGSALAQRLLFAHTPEGDLTPCFSGFFDTSVGAKTSAASFAQIGAALRIPAGRVLFLSDVAAELEAARAAGCRTGLCVRPGNPPQTPSFPADVIRTFDEISLV